MITRATAGLLAPLLATVLLAAPAQAAKCGGDFATFIAAISKEAAA